MDLELLKAEIKRELLDELEDVIGFRIRLAFDRYRKYLHSYLSVKEFCEFYGIHSTCDLIWNWEYELNKEVDSREIDLRSIEPVVGEGLVYRYPVWYLEEYFGTLRLLDDISLDIEVNSKRDSDREVT